MPEGTPVHEYRHVPEAERSERIDLVEDLVIGGDSEEGRFYRARDLAVDGEGNIYVLDTGNHRIQAFDGDGGFLRTIGFGEGQGPGEFGSPVSLAIADERLVVADNGNGRFSTWSFGGDHLADHPAERQQLNADRLTGLPGGDLLARFAFGGMPDVTFVVARLSPEGEELQRYLEVTTTPMAMPRAGATTTAPALQLPFEFPGVGFVAPDRLYLARADEYQLLAVDLAGEPRWAVRVSMRRPLFLEGEDGVATRAREQWKAPTVNTANYDTPEHFAALSRVAVDGRGRIFVFPFTPAAVYRPSEVDVPVDVFSADGERLFVGTMPDVEWRAAHQGHVYAIRSDEVSEELEVVRYRIVAPFD